MCSPGSGLLIDECGTAHSRSWLVSGVFEDQDGFVDEGLVEVFFVGGVSVVGCRDGSFFEKLYFEDAFVFDPAIPDVLGIQTGFAGDPAVNADFRFVFFEDRGVAEVLHGDALGAVCQIMFVECSA